MLIGDGVLTPSMSGLLIHFPFIFFYISVCDCLIEPFIYVEFQKLYLTLYVYFPYYERITT